MISVKNKQDCTGCYACSSVCPMAAIAMEADSEGFWYPVMDYDRCTRCGMCMTVCPTMEAATEGTLNESVPEAYAAYCVDEELRLRSSSGGLFTLLSETVVGGGGVVFGARFDEDFNVIHDYAENTEHLCRLRGSKYVQSRIGGAFRQAQEFLECGRVVMFTGTPCQISGLKYFLGQEYDSLICQDIICHGVPSPKVWQKYVTYRENCAASATRTIDFRRKDEGWKRFSVSFQFENNAEYVQSFHDDLYMKAFLSNICLRPSCYECHFKSIHRESDITLADFWGIQYLIPAMDDDKGTSLVVLHTQKAIDVFSGLRDKMRTCPVHLSEAIKYNSVMVNSANTNPNRDAFFLSLDDERIDVLVKKHCTDKLGVRLRGKLVSGVGYILKRLGLFHEARSRLLRR